MYIISQSCSQSIKIRRSEFIAHLHFAANLAQAKEIISQISKEYRNATHNCWAYILGEKGETYHCSDSGEPSGTAGKPILGVLQKHELTYVVAVVTRYFGGVKLGVRGLIDAYAEATENALNQAGVQELLRVTRYLLDCSYKNVENVKHHLEQMGLTIEAIDYQERVTIEVAVPEDKQKEAEQAFEKWQGGEDFCFQEI